MLLWRRVLVEAIGAASSHPLLWFPWRSCKTSTMVLCTTRCRQEKGERKDLSSRWYHCSPSRSLMIVSTTLSLHLCPWHAQVDIILGLPVLVHGSERSLLSSVWVTSCAMAEIHWHSMLRANLPASQAQWDEQHRKLQPATFLSCCGSLFPLTSVLPKAQNLPVNSNVIS